MKARVLFYNRPNVLVRLVGLFSKPGFNIEDMTVSPSEEPGLSNMWVKVGCNQTEFQLIFKQIEKLQDVVQINLVELDEH